MYELLRRIKRISLIVKRRWLISFVVYGQKKAKGFSREDYPNRNLVNSKAALLAV